MSDATIDEIKAPATSAPVHELIAQRFSPRGFADRPVDGPTLRSLFEAARWAPSCFNEQPFRYLVATKADPEAYERLLGVLVEGNQGWAKSAPVLALGLVAKTFARNGKDNAHARHDLGLATGNLSLEATARGLYVHQMAGIQPDVARERYALPEDVEAVTAIAIGWLDPDSEAPGDRDPRERRPLAETVFEGRWGTAATFD